ncbi:hypothetical protein [Allocoleopsis sp.]|uniref:hypothetical protein n=1 Tax=Allocoleopsis sp. TaxID=3088169 RepID=UPI002FCF4BD3
MEGVTKKYKGRGGKRPGAGGKPTWKLGKTQTIRVPVTIAHQLAALSREIDVNTLSEKDAIALIEELILIVREKSDF